MTKRIISLITATIFLMTMMSTVLTVNAQDLSVGYGSGDITQQLQNALDTTRYGGSANITVTPGSYTINDAVKIYSNTNLNLYGVTIVKAHNSSSMFRFGREEDSNNCYGYSGFSNISINGGTFNGNYNGEQSLFRFAHAQNIAFNNVAFLNNNNSHFVEFAGSQNVTFSGCSFSGQKCSDKNNSNTDAIQIDIMNNEKHFPSYGAYDDTPSKNVTITSCSFSNINRGVGTHSGVAGSFFENINITGNNFSNIYGYCIITTNYKNSSISNNVMTDNVGSGILVRGITPDIKNYYMPNSGNDTSNKSGNVNISGNQIAVSKTGYDKTKYGIYVDGAVLSSSKNGVAAGDYRVYGTSITSNAINIKSCGYGIWTDNAVNTSIASNTITSAINEGTNTGGAGDCIRVENSSSNITSNTLNNTGTGSASKDQTGITAKNSTVSGSYNTANSPRNCGIFATDKSSVNMNNFTVNNAGKNGITVQSSSSLTAKSLTVNKAKAHGVSVLKSGKINLTSANIKSAKKNGICLNNTKATITSSKVTSSGTNGISLSAKSKLTMKKSTITKSKNHGISIDKSTSTLTSNKITSNKKNGICVLNSSTVTATSNTIESNSNHGIGVYSGKLTMNKNKIRKNKQYGLYKQKTKKASAKNYKKNTYKSNKKGKYNKF